MRQRQRLFYWLLLSFLVIYLAALASIIISDPLAGQERRMREQITPWGGR